jgi:esterase/lipase superfamily enzyme
LKISNTFRAFVLISVLVVGLTRFDPAIAQTSETFDPFAFEVSLARAQSAVEKLTLVESAIVEVENEPSPDLAAYFDLNDLRLELLMDAGEGTAAADLASGLATIADANREQLDRDPLRYTKLAAQLFEETGNFRQALRMLEAEAALRLDAGQTGKLLARVYEDMERLSLARGDTASAEKFAGQMESALAPAETGNRGAGDAGFSEVDVFYATDRARSGNNDPDDFYGYERGDLEYGIVTVSIPSNHVPGAIEAPSIWRLEFGPKPTKHVMVRKIDPLEKTSYFAEMRAKVSQSKRNEAFVFVHGFNSRFDAAAKRAAQLAYDMNYSGVPILYSWPSAGKTFNYVADTAVVRLSGRRLSTFLEELHAKSGAKTIHIVAHSMGNRALTDALELLALRTNAKEGSTPMFGQLFFAAPDVDAGLFQEMMRTIRPLAQRLTLYASEADWALAASRKLHGDAPRAGQAGDSILSGQFFDTVDMSNLGEDMLAHTYFANDSSALADIVSLIWLNPGPGQRCGLNQIREVGEKSTWKYQKGACLDRKLVGLISRLWNSGTVTADNIHDLVQSMIDDSDEAERLEKTLISLLETN